MSGKNVHVFNKLNFKYVNNFCMEKNYYKNNKQLKLITNHVPLF
jgi:hypothetical protein